MIRYIPSILFVLSFSLASVAHAGDEEENRRAYEEYERILNESPKTKDGLTELELRVALANAVNRPIANLKDRRTVGRYDPTGAIGFCFGRSMAAHLSARMLGLKPESLRKLFVIGDMRSGPNPEWRFHVTFIAKGVDGNWHALDPITPSRGGNGRVVTAQEWLTWVRQTWDSHNFSKYKTNAYITSADVIIPNIKVSPEATAENNIDIMSTSFKPETHEGVKKVEGTERLYDVSGPESVEFQKKHFISANETGSDRYDMTEITINGTATYSYNRYFLDMLRETARVSSEMIQSGMKRLDYLNLITEAWRNRLSPARFFSPESAGRSRGFGSARSRQMERRAAENRIEVEPLGEAEALKVAGMNFLQVETDIDIKDCLR